MNPGLNFKKIAFPQIDFEDFTYAISPERGVVPDETLNKSIARHGILHPPIIRETNSGFYIIVAGRKRLLTAGSPHTESTCDCLVISRRTPEVDVFNVLLEENQLTRELTIVEKAIFLQKTTAITDERYIIRQFLPRLGLAPHAFSIKQTLKLLDLEEPILHNLHHGRINETVAHDFLLLSTYDRMALLKIITSLRLSFSYQKKMLNICRELAGRGNTSIEDLLDNDEVHGILNHQDANPPQKTKNLMLWLSRKYMPQSRQAEEEFNQLITAMQLPKNVFVEHTPFFENDSITLAITFRNRKSLLHAWKKIRHATHSNDD